MAEASRQQVLASVKSFFTSGKYSDLVITCGSDSYNVHKVVVCNRADFFARAVEFGGKEATEGNVNLPTDEPGTVKLLVQYLYEGEYEPRLSTDPPISTSPVGDMSQREIVRGENRSAAYDRDYTYDFPHTCIKMQRRSHLCTNWCLCPHHQCGTHCDYTCRDFICDQCTRSTLPKIYPTIGPPEQLLVHAKMYEIADKYDVVGLKELVLEKFKRACVSFWNDDTFSVAAHYAFSTTMESDKGLRDIVSATISKHKELLHKSEIQALMTEFNTLALSVLMKMAG